MKSENKPIRTIPDGVWEATHTDDSAGNCHRTRKTSAGNPGDRPPKERKFVEPF